MVDDPGGAEPTASSLLAEAVIRLHQAGVREAAFDAELLLRHLTGWDRAAVLTRGGERLGAGAVAEYRALVAQRARRRPLQHLTGRQAFWRHEFEVTPDVLIPRPETELLVEAALEALAGIPEPLVVDVGTGSGCIALSLAAERPDAVVHAVDISPAALDVVARNAERLGLAGRVTCHAGDLLAPVMALAGSVHVVVSNPPYVADEERASLEPEVRDHEPPAALFAAGGWRALYRRLAGEAATVLAPGGHLMAEVGQGMSAEVEALWAGQRLEVVGVRADLQGIPRVVVGRRPRATVRS